MSTHCSPSPSTGLLERQHPGSRQDLTPEQELGPAEDLSHAVLLGNSAGVRRMHSQIERIAPYFRMVLLRGERGTGKRQVAYALHRLGPGATSPFVSCSAAMLTESLSGEPASPSLSALLNAARGGTLYLEDIGNLCPAAQTALMGILRNRDAVRGPAAEIHRGAAGRPETRALEARIIAASDRDLKTLAALGRFRTDLYDRVSVVEIVVPALRQRLDDLPELTDWLLERAGKATARARKVFSAEALHQLALRSWPGNLRELHHVVEHAAQQADTAVIEPQHVIAVLQQHVNPERTRPDAAEAKADRLQDVIRHHVLDVLARCGGNKLRAAELLGISRSTLYRMLDAEPHSPHQDGAA